MARALEISILPTTRLFLCAIMFQNDGPGCLSVCVLCSKAFMRAFHGLVLTNFSHLISCHFLTKTLHSTNVNSCTFLLILCCLTCVYLHHFLWLKYLCPAYLTWPAQKYISSPHSGILICKLSWHPQDGPCPRGLCLPKVLLLSFVSMPGT